MTKKELIDGVSMYYDILKVNRAGRTDFDEIVDDEVFENLYEGKSIVINSLPGIHKVATLVFSKIARQTKESSEIWCCLGTIKGNDEHDKLELYYKFLDLETMTPKFVSSLEYSDFCKNNTVIFLDEFLDMYYPNLSNDLNGYIELRNLYISDIAKIILNLNFDLDKFNLNRICNHYDKVVAYFKKIGRETISIKKNNIIHR